MMGKSLTKHNWRCSDYFTFFTSTNSRWITCTTSILSTTSIALTQNASCAIGICHTITLSTSITICRCTICIGNHTIASYWNIDNFVYDSFKVCFKLENILTYTIWSICITSIIVIPCRTSIAHHTLITSCTIWKKHLMWTMDFLFYHTTKYLPHWPSLPQLPLFPFVPPVWHPQAAM